MRAARREVAGERIGEAVGELTTKVSELVGGTAQQEGLDLGLERFDAALQEVVARFDSGEIGQRRAMAGFRAAFEDFIDAVRSLSAADVPPAGSEASPGPDAGAVSDLSPGDAPASAVESGGLVENLGQVFGTFLQDLQSGLAALPGMRMFMAAENRDRIAETFVDLYRELAGSGTGAGADNGVGSGGLDQVA